MDISKLEVEMEFKNYKELCSFINEPIKTGEAKIKQLKTWESYFNWEQKGHKFKITKIIDNSKYTQEEELVVKYGTQKMIDTFLERGFKDGERKIFQSLLRERCDFSVTQNNEYLIKEIYEVNLPKNITKMKKGLYQYMIPLILHNVIKNKDKKYLLSITPHKLAKNIRMINNNYDTIKNNKSAFSYYGEKQGDLLHDNISVLFNEKNFCDYFNRVDKYITYYVHNAIEYMRESSMLEYQHVFYIDEVKKGITVDTNDNSVNVDETEEHIIRRATDDEIKLYLKWDTEACAAADINVLDGQGGQRWYGSKSTLYQYEYQRRLRNYNETVNGEYNIIKIFKVYELFVSDIEYCKTCLQYFDDWRNVTKLTCNFNNMFSEMINNNAQKRIDNKPARYSDTYLNDYDNLIEVTIPSLSENLKSNPDVMRRINYFNKKNIEHSKTINYKTI